MEWYLWALIGYAVYVLAVFVVFLKMHLPKHEFGFVTFLQAVLTYLFLLVVGALMPLIGVIWFLWWTVQDVIKNETFTLFPLSEDNKTTLRQLWFDEGTFVSHFNFEYQGFRKQINRTVIYIAYNGRVSVWGDLTDEVKFLIKQIQELPELKLKAEESEVSVANE